MDNRQIHVFPSIQEAIQALFGADCRIAGRSAVAGGDANDAYLLTLTDGQRVFLKENTLARAAFFEAEAEGLSAIAQTGTIRTPALYGRGTDARTGRSFLLMEYIAGAGQIPDFWEVFAAQLAALHRADTSAFVPGGTYGFLRDNFIGAGEQENAPADSWIRFFAERRLEPQIRKASVYFDAGERRVFLRLLDRLEELLAEPSHPSLLHGDLWVGNFVTGSDGRAWLIDPAVYVGHAEADIAMTELFGGFSPRFYAACRQEGDLDEGYADRRDLYNLYHLLNHLNLFGAGYYSAVMRTARHYAGG